MAWRNARDATNQDRPDRRARAGTRLCRRDSRGTRRRAASTPDNGGTDVFGPPVALLIETASEEMETLWRFGAHMLAAYQRVAHAQVRTLADTLSVLAGTSDRTSGCSPLPVHAAAPYGTDARQLATFVVSFRAVLMRHHAGYHGWTERVHVDRNH
jgi:hypothetical protein